MNVAIIGSREFDDYNYMVNCVLSTVVIDKIDFIVSGGARGADTLAERFAKGFGIPLIVYPAEWTKYGKSAGFMRNTDIISKADIVLAFPIGESKGTYDSINKARKMNKLVYIFKKEISDVYEASINSLL